MFLNSLRKLAKSSLEFQKIYYYVLKLLISERQLSNKYKFIALLSRLQDLSKERNQDTTAELLNLHMKGMNTLSEVPRINSQTTMQKDKLSNGRFWRRIVLIVIIWRC